MSGSIKKTHLDLVDIADAGVASDESDVFPLATFAAAAAASPATLVNNAAKPVGTIPQLADYLINGFWQFNNTIAHHWPSSTISYNIGGLTAAEQFLAQSALEAWHEVANVTFVQTSGAANITFNHSGTMTAFESDNYTGSGSMISSTVDISADWITSDGGALDGKTGIDSYGYQTYIHEIGHALGLGHQGPYNGSASYSTTATYADDTWQYSVMSYFAQDNYSGSSHRYVITPQMADIYAVDSIYGAASTRTGNTVYGFHDNAGSIFDFTAYSQAPALTIYDSSGNDALDCSGYSVAQTIDLHPGSFSSVGGLVHNIGIATTTIIENAIGGSGNDTLIANDLGCTLTGGGGNDTLIGGTGNDRLIGGVGIDVMTGGGGADTFVFAASDSSAASGQQDLITDFTSGVDHIDLSAIDAIAASGSYDLFRFLGATAFDGVAGELDYFYNSSLGVTVLQGDTNGDRIADFAIDLSGNVTISVNDVIGVMLVTTVIESFGSTSLTQVGNNYYLDSISTGTGPELTFGGAVIAAGQFGTIAPIGAEQTGSGYDVAWKVPGADQYIVWSVDGSGNYLSTISGPSAVSGSSTTLEAFETAFHQDLNGDGVIGVPTTTVIESFGSTSLTQVGNNYYLDSISLGTGPELKFGGAAIAVGQFGTIAPIGAEQTGSGYDVAWKVPGADQYIVWSVDGSGNYLSTISGPSAVSGSSTTLESFETAFNQDFNGDGVIGIPVATTMIESFGSTSVTEAGNNYYLDSISTGTGPELKFGGAVIVAGQFGTIAPIGGEQTGSGYDVAWKVPGADQYIVWSVDGSGNYLSTISGSSAVSGSSTTLESFETTFHQDLNGDGAIGFPAAASLAPALAGARSALATFAGSTLTLDSSSVFSGQIIGFAGDGTSRGSDQIDLRGMNYSSIHSTFDSSTGILAVSDGTNTTDLDFLGNYSQASFKFADDGGGGSIIYGQVAAGQAPPLGGAALIPVGGSNGTSAGQDTFVFGPHFGHVTIPNFAPETDTIQISKAVFANIDALLAATHDDSHGNAIITDAALDTIAIQNVTTAQLQAHQGHFHLV